MKSGHTIFQISKCNDIIFTLKPLVLPP